MSSSETGQAPTDYFAVCPTEEIAAGAAKAFDLMEADGQGGGRPFRIVIVRNDKGGLFCYRNACPHDGVWLNIGSGAFFDETGALLRCGRHGATFDLVTGECASGPCEGARLERVGVTLLDGDVCVYGVALVEDDGRRGDDKGHRGDDGGHRDDSDDLDETMDITIHP